MSITVSKGQLFCIPLWNKEYCLGLVAHVDRAKFVYYYIFDVRFRKIPLVEEVAELASDDAFHIRTADALPIRNGDWPILGIPSWFNSVDWPVLPARSSTGTVVELDLEELTYERLSLEPEQWEGVPLPTPGFDMGRFCEGLASAFILRNENEEARVNLERFASNSPFLAKAIHRSDAAKVRPHL